MTERHAESARSILDSSMGIVRDETGASAEAAEMIAEAQVHATLALVEQQRIANLIALADHASELFGNYAGEAGGMGTLFSHPEDEGGNMRLRDDVRKALGLS
jgi:hypothetical protein